jgi:ABC-2 type transport system ATP-binding protein
MQGVDPVIRARGLSVRLGGEIVLDSVSFVVEEGVTALLGPNGAGKSTLLGTILGMHPPCAGEIEVLGRVHGDFEQSRAIWSEIGYLPQGFTGTARQRIDDFLTYSCWLAGQGLAEAPAEVEAALALSGLTGRRRSRVGELSGGMLRRLGVATAALGSPSMVLLDEPGAGLDLLHRDDLVEVIRRLRERCRSVVVTTHLPEDIRGICDHALFMDGGRVVDTWSSGSVDLVDAYRSSLRGIG